MRQKRHTLVKTVTWKSLPFGLAAAALFAWGPAASAEQQSGQTPAQNLSNDGDPCRLQDDKRPHVVFMIGEREYDTKTSLPEFAKSELAPLGFRTTFVHVAKEDRNDFPGLEALRGADLLVISVRRRTPKKAQLNAVRDYVKSGRPIVGLRTASHAFDRKPPGDDYAAWPKFDDEILGGDYQGHYGGQTKALVRLTKAGRKHPIMRGVTTDEFPVTTHLYRNRNMAATTTTLMTGQVAGREKTTEPVCWVNDRKGQRVFYTSLGGPGDFRIAAFRRVLLGAICWTTGKPNPEE